jgi:hypothetical protein
MKEITYLNDCYLGKFNTAEYVNLMSRVIGQCIATGKEALHYEDADMQRMQTLLSQLQNNVARSMALAETPELQAMDRERTNLAQYIITNVRNAQNLPIKAKAEAAKALYVVLKPYTGFYANPMLQRTSIIDGMLYDLSQEDNAAHVTTLGMDEYVESLTLTNAKYKVYVEQRTVSRSALRGPESAVLRTEMDALYKYLTTVAFAHNVVTPSDDIDHFIFYVNDILSEVNTSYNQRMAAKTESGKGKTENSVETGNGEVSPEGSEPSQPSDESEQ